MHIPEAFREKDEAILLDVMAANPFATVVSNGPDAPEITLLPVIFDPEKRELVGHFSKANPHWKSFTEGGRASVIFHGPHAYISPTWYETSPNVPTWAYVTAVATGPVELLKGDAAVEDLLALVDRFDPNLSEDLPASVDRAMIAHMAAGVVAFRIKVEKLEGKFKVGQNKLDADRLSAAKALEDQGLGEMARLYRRG